MTRLADILTTVFERRYMPLRGAGRDDRPIEALCEDLLTRRGEVSGVTLARRILDRYGQLDDSGRRGFFDYLATEMDVDVPALEQATERYKSDPGGSAYRDLMAAAEPRRQELARRLNRVPGATARLVEMRADLLRFLRHAPALARVDQDFRHLFASWFNRGFLVLQPVDWSSPAKLLDKIIAYEAVHAIDSWDDLRLRLKPEDRRCFAFFHPAMPEEPLIFVEVALTRGVAGSIQEVLTEDREVLPAEDADTAVFYSISNCQKGLAGISFGNSLIKQVAQDLSRDLPNLKTFVTLSPIPGLRAWLEEEGQSAPEDADTLRRLAAQYLLEAKRDDGSPRDPVARFHLSNGASVHDVHAGADVSAKGIAQSGGAMVNYLYDLRKVAQNHEEFVGQHQIAAAPSVRALARAAQKRSKESEPTP